MPAQWTHKPCDTHSLVCGVQLNVWSIMMTLALLLVLHAGVCGGALEHENLLTPVMGEWPNRNPFFALKLHLHAAEVVWCSEPLS